jgi:hypothetical protein
MRYPLEAAGLASRRRVNHSQKMMLVPRRQIGPHAAVAACEIGEEE